MGVHNICLLSASILGHFFPTKDCLSLVSTPHKLVACLQMFSSVSVGIRWSFSTAPQISYWTQVTK